ncbi:hypothetical protein [Sphingomonas immobilis]|uniref:Transposase n=1 Tax=Sphingomonas immobilis TaxID=3063997 RepID=A0ABT8ZWT6_9SPHN|nr:hypothetical protein [Sphingomonas sp. CA1-15]MDO7841490.1 hypothetical protein [Sphingomonas sp. CA1-15]
MNLLPSCREKECGRDGKRGVKHVAGAASYFRLQSRKAKYLGFPVVCADRQGLSGKRQLFA